MENLMNKIKENEVIKINNEGSTEYINSSYIMYFGQNKKVSEVAKSKWEQVKNKLILVEGWARDGLTDEQIAQNLGISKDTFYEYKKKYPDFSDSLKKGKEIVDYEVENALLQSALKGNVTAQIYWLNNRKPKQWKNKRIDEDTETEDTSKDNLEQLSVEELKAIAYASINRSNTKES